MKAMIPVPVATRLAGAALAACLALAVPASAPAQSQGAITPNYKDADLGQIIEAVSAVTGKNFIVDPRVRAQVTMLSSTPMSPAAFYEAFLSILQVHGFVAVPSGDVVKIVPDANARQLRRRVIVPADCVDTYDRGVAVAAEQGGLPHDADLLHAVFLYHMALNELGDSVRDVGDQVLSEMLHLLVEGKRLRDISDLPFDLAI